MAAKKQRKTAGVVRRHVRALDRQKAVLAAILAGKTLTEAAEAAGYAGKQGAQQARETAVAAIEGDVRALAAEYRRQAEERIAAVMAAVLPLACRGEMDAIDRYIRLEARWSKLRGGDAPKKLEHTGPDGRPIEVDATEDLLAALARRTPPGDDAGGPSGGDPKPEAGGG